MKSNSKLAYSNAHFQALTLSSGFFSSKYLLTVILVVEEFQKTQENKYISYIIKQNKEIVMMSPFLTQTPE